MKLGVNHKDRERFVNGLLPALSMCRQNVQAECVWKSISATQLLFDG